MAGRVSARPLTKTIERQASLAYTRANRWLQQSGALALADDKTLDTSGLSCPIPILKARKALSEMAAGSTLTVLATDPAAPKDFAAFCRASGHQLVESLETGDAFRFVIRCAG